MHFLTGSVIKTHVAQVPILAARPSGLTVLPIQPMGSQEAEPSAQLQELPENVSAP